MFTQSPIFEELPSIITIDESNYKTYQNDSSTQEMRGYLPDRDFDKNPVGGFASLYSDPLIPQSEWKDRIEMRVKTKSSLYDLYKNKKVPMLNQQRTNYCWCFGLIGGFQVVRAKSNLPTLKYSAASLAAKIKNYRNVGGWAEQAIKGMDKYGCSTVKYWPEAAIDRRYDTPEQRANANLNKLTEVQELPQNSISHIVTGVLNNHPVTLGLNWWGHLVFAIDVVYRNGQYFVLICNSWGTGWSEQGFGLLTLDKATAFEAFALKRCSLSTAA